MCRKEVTIQSITPELSELFHSLNQDLGTVDLQIGAHNPREYDRIVALTLDLPEFSDLDLTSESCDKLFEYLAYALPALVSSVVGKELNFGVVVLVSFKKNLFVVSGTRVMDVTEFSLFFEDGFEVSNEVSKNMLG